MPFRVGSLGVTGRRSVEGGGGGVIAGPAPETPGVIIVGVEMRDANNALVTDRPPVATSTAPRVASVRVLDARRVRVEALTPGTATIQIRAGDAVTQAFTVTVLPSL